MSWLIALVTATIGFVFGRIFSQSEQILSEKRRVYEEFLRNIPQPSDLAGGDSASKMKARSLKLDELKGPLAIYASSGVMAALSDYLFSLAKIATKQANTEAVSNALVEHASQAQNNVIIEMRRDSLAWSVFAYTAMPRKLEPPAE